MDHTGVVEKVFKKQGTNRNGKPYTLFSARIAGLEQWASFGFKDPGISEGDIVKIRGEIDGNNLKVEQHRVEGKGEVPTKPAYSGKPAYNKGGGNSARDEYFKEKEKHDRDEREPRIQYQAARKDALEFLSVLAGQDALPITAAAGKGNKAKRFEELEEILDKLTVRFYNDTRSLRVLERVQDSDEEERTKAEPLPEVEPPQEEAEEESFDDDVPF